MRHPHAKRTSVLAVLVGSALWMPGTAVALEARLLNCSYADGQLNVELKMSAEAQYLAAGGAPWAPPSLGFFYSEDLWGSNDAYVDCGPEITGPLDSVSVKDVANVR